jgi:hypothetical protein
VKRENGGEGREERTPSQLWPVLLSCLPSYQGFQQASTCPDRPTPRWKAT